MLGLVYGRFSSFMFRCSVLRIILLVVACALPTQVWCSPFISSDAARLRANLVFLSNSGVLDSALTTWPIMWRDLARGLARADMAVLTPAQKNAVYELRFELKRERDSVYKRSIALQASNSTSLYTQSSNSDYEKLSLVKTNDWDGDNISLRLQAQLLKDDDYKTNLDGSYLVGALGDWVLGVGAIDRWWGPGNGSSLILSHNARPAPGLIFRTNGEQRFESAWLSWLGPWQFTSFVSQLESDRHIPEAKLTGMRFSFRPIDSLELGASRAMMWGGEGRSNDLSSFWDSLTASNENTYDGLAGTGNQLGGFDARYGRSIGDLSAAIYAQLIGEDEAGGLPSKYLSLFGVQFAGSVFDGRIFDVYLEYSDTTAGSLNEPEFGVAYEHSAYQSGYRFRGRALGSSFDGDAMTWSMGAKLLSSNGRTLSLNIIKAKLNRASRGRANTLARNAQNTLEVELGYEFLWRDAKVAVKVGHQDVDETIIEVEDFRVGLALEYRY